MFPAQLKIKSESSGRQQTLLPRQPFSWLFITKHNLEQFLSPAVASKQQKWTMLHSLTMTVSTWLYWPQKAVVALLSLISLTSCFFLWEGEKKKESWQGFWFCHRPRPPTQCVWVYQCLASLHICCLELSVPWFDLLASQAGEIITPEPAFPSHKVYILTRSCFATVWMHIYICARTLTSSSPSFPFSLHTPVSLSLKLLLSPNPPSLRLNWITPLSNTGQVGGEAANGKHFSFWL